MEGEAMLCEGSGMEGVAMQCGRSQEWRVWPCSVGGVRDGGCGRRQVWERIASLNYKAIIFLGGIQTSIIINP